MNMPLAANRRGESIMMRVRFTARERTSSLRPGAMIGTSSGARSSPTIANTKVTMTTRFRTALARRQASAGVSRNRRANTGIKAAPRVAPARTWKMRSGSLKATQ